MKYLIVLMISLSSFAGNFSEVEKVKTCEVEKVYKSKFKCESKENSACIKVPEVFNCDILKVGKRKIQDLESPIWGTRSMVTSCLDEADCALKRSELVCSSERISFVNAEFTEVWCNKIIDYNMIETDEDIIVIDEEKKTLYDAKMVKKKNKEDKLKRGRSKRQNCSDSLGLITETFSDQDEAVSDALELQFADVLDALRKCKYKKAKRLINEKVVPPEMEPLKTELIEKMK